MTNIQGPILGIISFAAAILLFSFPYIEKNIVLIGVVCGIMLIEFLYHFKFAEKKNPLKAGVKLLAAVVLGVNVFVALPQSLNMIAAILILIVALYEIFPMIISTE